MNSSAINTTSPNYDDFNSTDSFNGTSSNSMFNERSPVYDDNYVYDDYYSDYNGATNNSTFNESYDYSSDNYGNGTLNNSDTMHGDYGDWNNQDYTEFVYEAFDFERPIYLYVWEIFVSITVLVNMLVIWVLLRKKMRSATNMILVAIAISDSLTGLVTLPTYIMVYQSTHSGEDIMGENLTDQMYDNYEYGSYDYSNYDNYMDNGTEYSNVAVEHKDAYFLSKSLCVAFMISKFFLSKSFHTISIWLTVYLGVQRYISVAYPFRVQVWFTTRNTLIVCVAIAVAAPFLHLYHLIDEKAVNGYCTWELKERCSGDCLHMWLTLLLRHLIPCAVLTVTTILFVRHLSRNPFNSAKSGRKHSSVNEARGAENRRVTKIVIAIVIGLLVPEVPYGIFLLFTSTLRISNLTHMNDLKRNRAIHAGYELLLVLTFHLNFYVYTFLNPRFRKQLMKTGSCVRSRVKSFRSATNMSDSSGRRTVGPLTTKTESVSHTQDSKGTEMKSLNHSSEDQSNDKLT